eukprot:m.175926 g.175926  ORF g.175926 m.175926 type:complete len:108 (-) comp31835_c6_seq1:391-714(-)
MCIYVDMRMNVCMHWWCCCYCCPHTLVTLSQSKKEPRFSMGLLVLFSDLTILSHPLTVTSLIEQLNHFLKTSLCIGQAGCMLEQNQILEIIERVPEFLTLSQTLASS